MNLLITEESYGWARRKITEAKVALASYLAESGNDGNAILVSSLEDIKQALLYIDCGDSGIGLDAVQEGGSTYYKLIEYIDGAIAATNLLDDRSAFLYNFVFNLVSVTELLLGQVEQIWGFNR